MTHGAGSHSNATAALCKTTYLTGKILYMKLRKTILHAISQCLFYEFNKGIVKNSFKSREIKQNKLKMKNFKKYHFKFVLMLHFGEKN